MLSRGGAGITTAPGVSFQGSIISADAWIPQKREPLWAMFKKDVYGTNYTPYENGAIVITSSTEGTIWCINPDGTLRWKFDVSDWTEFTTSEIYGFSPPVVDYDGTIYTIDVAYGFLWAITRDGKLKWMSYVWENTDGITPEWWYWNNTPTILAIDGNRGVIYCAGDPYLTESGNATTRLVVVTTSGVKLRSISISPSVVDWVFPGHIFIDNANVMIIGNTNYEGTLSEVIIFRGEKQVATVTFDSVDLWADVIARAVRLKLTEGYKNTLAYLVQNCKGSMVILAISGNIAIKLAEVFSDGSLSPTSSEGTPAVAFRSENCSCLPIIPSHVDSPFIAGGDEYAVAFMPITIGQYVAFPYQVYILGDTGIGLYPWIRSSPAVTPDFTISMAHAEGPPPYVVVAEKSNVLKGCAIIHATVNWVSARAPGVFIYKPEGRYSLPITAPPQASYSNRWPSVCASQIAGKKAYIPNGTFDTIHCYDLITIQQDWEWVHPTSTISSFVVVPI